MVAPGKGDHHERVNLLRLRLLLAAWVVLAVAPGLVVGFLADDLASTTPGWAVGAWIVGWIAQFAVFMVVARIGDLNGNFLLWITASLGAFGVDWTPLRPSRRPPGRPPGASSLTTSSCWPSCTSAGSSATRSSRRRSRSCWRAGISPGQESCRSIRC